VEAACSSETSITQPLLQGDNIQERGNRNTFLIGVRFNKANHKTKRAEFFWKADNFQAAQKISCPL
jgi:hypothetical protein